MDYKQKCEVRSMLHVTILLIGVNINCNPFHLFTILQKFLLGRTTTDISTVFCEAIITFLDNSRTVRAHLHISSK